MASSGVTFTFDDLDYIADLETLREFAEAFATEVEAARNGEASLDDYLGVLVAADNALAASIAANLAELTAARNGQASLNAFLALLVAKAGLTQDLLAGGFKITGAGDGVAAQDYATMANLSAQISAGGNPGDIPITSLNIGTATAKQNIRINAAGTGVEGARESRAMRHFFSNS